MRAASPARRGNRFQRLFAALLLLAAIVLALLAGAAFLIQSRIDPAMLRQRIEKQCLEATGRTLSLSDARLVLLPVPTLTATGVKLAGLPTDSRPEMLTATALSAHLALWPLLHHVAWLNGVTLTDPDLSLERDAAGNANWRFTPPARPAGPGSAPSVGARWRVQINSLRLRDGTIAWRDAVRGLSGNVALDRLDASGLAGDRPQADLAGRHGAAAFAAEINTGSLRRLTGEDSGNSPWPMNLSVRSSRNGREDGSLAVSGTLADPVRMRGFVLAVRLDAPRPDGIDALFPHAALPATGPVQLQARVQDDAPAGADAPVPVLQQLSLRAEHLDLGALLRRGWSRGLVLDRVAVDAADRDAPVRIAANGSWQNRAASVRGTVGTLRVWRPGGDGKPAPFTLELRSGDAKASLNGTAATDAFQAAVTLDAPALRAVSPVGPALTGLTLSANIGVSDGDHWTVDALDLRSKELALSGHLSLVSGNRPSLDATLSAAHADLDALRAGWVEPQHADDGPVPSTVSGPAPSGLPAGLPTDLPTGTPGTGTTVADAPAARSAVDHAVPFARLRCCDVALHLVAASMILDRSEYKAVSIAAELHDGVLKLSPVTGTGPAGPIDLSLAADAGAQTATLQLHPLSVPAETLAGWLHRAPVLDGAAEIVADLTAQGGSWDAMARTASGHAGLSMVDGAIATDALGQLIGRPQAAQVGGDHGGARTPFRCLALPAAISNGSATLDPLALSTNRLVVQGRGTVSLPDGALDLHLVPRLAIGATAASLPVRIGGTVDAPEAALDPAATGGRFSLSIGGAAPPDPCAAVLAASRFGVAGPAPGNAPEAGKRKMPKPIDILRGLGLFR